MKGNQHIFKVSINLKNV